MHMNSEVIVLTKAQVAEAREDFVSLRPDALNTANAPGTRPSDSLLNSIEVFQDVFEYGRLDQLSDLRGTTTWEVLSCGGTSETL
jgi:hypothetical protein